MTLARYWKVKELPAPRPIAELMFDAIDRGILQIEIVRQDGPMFTPMTVNGPLNEFLFRNKLNNEGKRKSYLRLSFDTIAKYVDSQRGILRFEILTCTAIFDGRIVPLVVYDHSKKAVLFPGENIFVDL